MKMYELLSLPFEERMGLYGTREIQYIVIDGNRFDGYKVFSSFWEKTYAKQPERTAGGVIGDLDNIPTFITFHIKVDFSMMSIEDYRRLYNLMLSKNEFFVTAYDVVHNRQHSCRMYFAPDQMPKLYAMARRLNGEKFIEVLGVQDYTIELIGTNNDDQTFGINYIANLPSDVSSSLSNTSFSVEDGETFVVGANALDIVNARLIGSNKTYAFSHWSSAPSGGTNYLNGKKIVAYKNIDLYARWLVI